MDYFNLPRTLLSLLALPSKSASRAPRLDGNNLSNCTYSPLKILSANFLGIGGEFIPTTVALLELMLMTLDRGVEGASAPPVFDMFSALLIEP